MSRYIRILRFLSTFKSPLPRFTSIFLSFLCRTVHFAFSAHPILALRMFFFFICVNRFIRTHRRSHECGLRWRVNTLHQTLFCSRKASQPVHGAHSFVKLIHGCLQLCCRNLERGIVRRLLLKHAIRDGLSLLKGTAFREIQSGMIYKKKSTSLSTVDFSVKKDVRLDYDV